MLHLPTNIHLIWYPCASSLILTIRMKYRNPISYFYPFNCCSFKPPAQQWTNKQTKTSTQTNTKKKLFIFLCCWLSVCLLVSLSLCHMKGLCNIILAWVQILLQTWKGNASRNTPTIVNMIEWKKLRYYYEIHLFLSFLQLCSFFCGGEPETPPKKPFKKNNPVQI